MFNLKGKNLIIRIFQQCDNAQCVFLLRWFNVFKNQVDIASIPLITIDFYRVWIIKSLLRNRGGLHCDHRFWHL